MIGVQIDAHSNHFVDYLGWELVRQAEEQRLRYLGLDFPEIDITSRASIFEKLDSLESWDIARPKAEG